MKKKDFKIKITLYTLVTLFFITGWYFTVPLTKDQSAYFTLLTIVSFFSTIVVLKSLLVYVAMFIHLWAIFLLLQVGYYLKLFILSFMIFNYEMFSEFLNGMYKLELDLLYNSNILLKSYEILTFSLVVFSVTVLLLKKKRDKKLNSNDKYVNNFLKTMSIPKIITSALPLLLALTTILFAITVYLQILYGIQLGHSIRQVTVLPYRLAGIIMMIQGLLVPLIFLALIWLCDEAKKKYIYLATLLYLGYGIVAGLVTTSKGPLILTILSLMLLWIVTGRFTLLRKYFVVAAIPFVVVFNGVLFSARSLRADLTISFVDTILESLYFFVEPSTLLRDVADYEKFAIYLNLLMRPVGIDALLIIVSSEPHFSFETLQNIFFSAVPVSQIYTRDILGVLSLTDVAFSPSLLGCFYLVSGSTWIIYLCVAIYTLIWHAIFCYANKLKIVLRPVLIALLLLLLAQYTSEGTLETLPRNVGIIFVVIMFAEFFVRTIGIRPLSRATVLFKQGT